MNTIKKIMFMSNDNNTNDMGILKLERKNNSVFGTIKTYESSINGNYILGIKLDEKIIKQNVNIENGCYSFISNEINSLDNINGCVLIELINGEFKPIIWGNSKNKNYKSHIINSLRQSINNISNAKTKQIIRKNNITDNINTDKSIYTKQNQYLNDLNEAKLELQRIAKLQSQNLLQNETEATPPYKHKDINNIETLAQISITTEPLEENNIPEIAISCNQEYLFESDDEEVEKTIDAELKNEFKSDGKFYNMIADQLQELFDKYPTEDNLNKLIENSYWVKIDTDIVNKQYVVGIINNNNDVKYICYGVPGNYNQEPPIEMKEYSQWLPIDIKDPYNNGYWVMYQDAESGENVYIN